MVTSKKMAPAWLLLLAALAAAVLPLATATGCTETITFNKQLGTSNEAIVAVFEYGKDFTGDSKNDIRMTFSVAAASNSGTEDLRGVVFDVTLPAGGLAGLTVGDVTKQPLTAAAAAGQKLSTAAIFKQVNINKIGDNQGMVDPGFTIAGTSGGQGQVNEPYDVGVKVSDQGAGEGIVQSFTMVLTAPGIDLEADTLLSNTDWYFRLQSTNGGSSSAKTGGYISSFPACNNGANPVTNPLSISKALAVDSAKNPGDSFSFTITASTTAAVTGVVITDDLPAGLTIPAGSKATWAPAGGSSTDCTYAAASTPEITCTIGNVAAATRWTVTVPVEAAAGTSGQLTNTATISGTPAGAASPSTNTAAADVTIQSSTPPVVNTCADADGAGNPHTCPPGWKTDTAAGVSSTVITTKDDEERTDACCERVPTCGDEDGAGQRTDAFDCGTGFTAKTGVADTSIENAADNTAKRLVCCDAVGAAPTCADDNGDGTSNDGYSCPPGWKTNTAAGVATTSTANMNTAAKTSTCCVRVPTCGDEDGAGQRTDAFDCGTGFTAKTGVADTSIENAADNTAKRLVCCDAVGAAPTCADDNGDGTSNDGYSCPPGWKTNTAAGVATTSTANMNTAAKTSTCCVRVPTCGDEDGAGQGTAAFDCGTGFTAKTGVADTSIENAADDAAKRLVCCDAVGAAPTCADDNGDGTSNDGYSCPPGWKTNTAAGVATTSTANMNTAAKTSTCCVRVPTCGDEDGAGQGTAAFDCGTGFTAKTGVADTSIENAADDAAKRLVCCDAVGAAPTCADDNGDGTSNDGYSCPPGWKTNTAAGVATTSTANMNTAAKTSTCCVRVPTCGDADGALSGTAGYTCPPGHKDSTAAGVSTTSIEGMDTNTKTSTCCMRVPTCGDEDGPGPLTSPFNCGTGFTAKTGVADTSIENAATDAAKRLACCDANAPIPPNPTPPITPFTIDKSSPGIAVANVPFDFSIAVTFVGAATGVVLTDTMGAGLTFAAGRTPVWTQTAGGSRTGPCVAGASASQVVCQLTGSWSTNDAVAITVPAVASSAGSFTNAAVITDSTSRTASDSETVTVIQPTLPPTPTDVIVTKTVSKASGVGVSKASGVMGAGDPPTFVFTVTLTAAPGAAVVNPELVDTMSPSGLEILGDIGSVPNGNCQRSSLQGFACSWLGLVLLPGETYTVSYTAVARKAGVYTNTAVSSRADDVNPSNNQASVKVEVTAPEPGPAELAVTKVGPSQATIASPITFTVTAGVAPGSRPASPLVLVEELSDNKAAFDLPLPDAACTRETPQRVRCTWANVGESDTKVLQFSVTGTDAGSFINTARVSSTAPGVKDKEATVPVTLLPETVPPVESTKIKLDKAGPGQVVNAGEEFDFTLTASVITGTAQTLTLIDALPAASGLKFVRATPAAPCTVTDLVASCTLTGPFPQTIKLTAVGQSKGSFTNTAQLSGAGDSSAASAPVNVFVATCGETTPGGKPFDRCSDGFAYNPRAAGRSPVNAAVCCEVSAQSAPSLTIRKSVNDAKVRVNDEVLFTIQVKNDGGLDGVTAQNAVVTDTLPVGLKPYTDRWTVTPSVGPTACTFAEANPRLMRCALGAIPAGETRTITIRCLADGSKLGLLSNVASVGCDKPSQQGVADPTCSKTSNPATVTVEKVIIPPQPEACAATLGMTISGSPRRAGKGSLLTWTLTLTPSNGTVLNVYAGNPVPTFLSSPTLTKPPAGGSCKFTAVKGQQILQCNFASISAPVTLQYTTRAAQAGTITSTAGATFKPCRTAANTEIKTTETVVVWEPVLGSCCDGSFGCKAGVAKIPCQRAGGTWSADLTACFSGKFCTGACCSGGGSMAAQCWMTTKDACPGSWDASTTCFDQNYCPRPCQSKCQQCTPGKDSCCPGFSCQQSGRFGKSYCLPVCTDKPQCSGAGGVCGLTAGGTKCCDGLDCIVGKGGVGVCAPRSTCKPAGATCGGYGECGSGLFCAPSGKCEPASCRPRGKFPRSASAQAQKNFHEYQCSAHFAATCSGRK
ncbi:hypothetical protein OEZ85_000465 [Tetradesmus obliquus]|uniref:DUF11 domain-containing protein n=1 Tax=Tetradesmus obliquus TaxID=3088 RepID=A0ABY8UIZ7_TETOB|nr:hypothetical protein OEZ85_000465 [Tetradesmus obliquus]